MKNFDLPLAGLTPGVAISVNMMSPDAVVSFGRFGFCANATEQRRSRINFLMTIPILLVK